MTRNTPLVPALHGEPEQFPLRTPLSVCHIAENCRQCRKCVSSCRFLQQNGTPGELARAYLLAPADIRQLSYSCSLCDLCRHVCPQNLNSAEMFLQLRRQALQTGENHLRPHRRLINYERFGSSVLFRCFQLPTGGTSVFFPGCALPGMRPEPTLHLYQLLRRIDPRMGIMLDCCNKPSRDLGRQTFFQDRFRDRAAKLAARGVTTIVTACPSCYQALSALPSPCAVTTVYSLLAANDNMIRPRFKGMHGTIHDPCTIRFSGTIHEEIRALCSTLGISIREMPHNRESTLCCGEGGGAGYIDSGLSDGWKRQRLAEAGSQPFITYCAGCTSHLHRQGKVYHLIDLLCAPTSSPKPLPDTVSPIARWYNRLKLKIQLLTGT